MISIKSGAYSKEENRILAQALLAAEEYIISVGCQTILKSHCKTCSYRHICNDLSSAREHAEALAGK